MLPVLRPVPSKPRKRQSAKHKKLKRKLPAKPPRLRPRRLVKLLKQQQRLLLRSLGLINTILRGRTEA